MATDGHFYNSTVSEFPEPTRPFEAHGSCIGSRLNHFPEKCHYNMPQYSNRASEGEGIVEMDVDLFQILREFAEEFEGEGHEILGKLFSKLENNVPMDHATMFKEKLQEFRGKMPELFRKLCKKMNPDGVKHSVIVERGLNCDSNSAELRLERFKVRTVNQGGVVKIEPEKN